MPFPSLRDALRRRLRGLSCELRHRCRLVLPDLPPAAKSLAGHPPSAALVPAIPVTWARKWRPPEGAASVAVGELKVAAVRAGGLGGLVLPERVWAFRRQGARCVAWARRAGTVGGTPRGEVPSLGLIGRGDRGGHPPEGFRVPASSFPRFWGPCFAGDWIRRLGGPREPARVGRGDLFLEFWENQRYEGSSSWGPA